MKKVICTEKQKIQSCGASKQSLIQTSMKKNTTSNLVIAFYFRLVNSILLFYTTQHNTQQSSRAQGFTKHESLYSFPFHKMLWLE